MSYREMHELVKMRHTLRSLAAPSDRETAASLIQRMSSLAALDPAESAAVHTELERWKAVFRLEM